MPAVGDCSSTQKDSTLAAQGPDDVFLFARLSRNLFDGWINGTSLMGKAFPRKVGGARDSQAYNIRHLLWKV